METAHKESMNATFNDVSNIENRKSELIPISNNSLLASAMPLLAFIQNIKNAEYCEDINKLQTNLIAQFEQFESDVQLFGYDQRTMLAARYCLCTALDEAVLNTEWGINSMWVQQSLLAVLHNETSGGQRFYIILKKLSENAESNLDVLELLYFILSLGFEGRYYNDNVKCELIRDNLFQTITTYKTIKPNLPNDACCYSNVINKKCVKTNFPLWILVIFTIVVLISITMGYESSLKTYTTHIVEQLSD